MAIRVGVNEIIIYYLKQYCMSIKRCQNTLSVYIYFCIYTEQKKKRNNRPPRIYDFKGKTLIISGLLLYDSNSWILGYIMQKLIFISIKIE